MRRFNSLACDCDTCYLMMGMWGEEVSEEECEKKVEEVEEEEEVVVEEEWDEYSECTRCGEDYYASEYNRGWGWCRDCEAEGERRADELEDQECEICGRRGEGIYCGDCRRYEINQGFDEEEE